MKQLLFFLVFLCSQVLAAQNDWIGNVHFYSSVKEIFPRTNGQIVLIMNGDGIVVLDTTGQLVKRFELDEEHSGTIGSLREVGDSILVYFKDYGCLNSSAKYLIFNNDWEYLGQKKIWASSNIGKVYELSDSSYISNYEGDIYHFNSGFDTLFNIDQTNGTESTLVILPGDTLIFYDSLKLKKMTKDFEEIKTKNIWPVKFLKLASDGNILAFGSNWIRRFDVNLNQLDYQSYSGSSFITAAVAEGEFAIMTDFPTVKRFDNNLQEIGEFEVDKLESMNLYALSYYGDKLLIGGRKKWGIFPNWNWSGFLKFYTLQGQTQPIEGDVALLDIQHLGSMSAVWIMNLAVWDATFTDIKLKIANNSSDTLRSFVLNNSGCSLISNSGCLIPRQYRWIFNDIQIPPGQIGEITMDSIQVLIKNTEMDEYAPCFWLSLPNDSWDTDNENDVFCTSLPVAAKPERVLKQFSVFPNPARDQLHVIWEEWMPTGQASFVLTDVLGRTVAVWEVESGSDQQNLELNSVPAGVYTLLLKADNGPVASARVVVE